MSRNLQDLYWPAVELGSAMESAAHSAGLSPRTVHTLPTPRSLEYGNGDNFASWIEAAATFLGIEAEPTHAAYQEIDQLLASVAPAIVRMPGEDPNFLMLLRSNHDTVTVLAPDLRELRVSTTLIREELCGPAEAQYAEQIDRLLAEAEIPQHRRPKARAALLRESLSSRYVGGCWLLRSSPSANFWHQARQQGMHRDLTVLMGAHALEYFLLLLSWWLIGRAALQGHLDYGWLLAWALLLLTLVPLRLLSTWLHGLLAIHGGVLLKRRLLYGALRLRPEETRHQSVGQFLGQVIESEVIETLALSAGFQGITAVVELIAACVVLWFGASGGLQVGLLLSWLVVTSMLAWRYFQQRQLWTTARLQLTSELTERMLGHRTRLAQEPREHWHDGEDKLLERYLGISKHMDIAAASLSAVVPRGWVLLGLLGLASSFISLQGSTTSLAISLGGILLAYRALNRVSSGLTSLAEAAISWQQVGTLFHAAARPQVTGSPAFALAHASNRDGQRTLMEAHDISFRYRDRGEPVLRGCSLAIRRGERLLLEGPSGGGKSTLASLLIGLREPQSGLLLLSGLDRQTVGELEWRRQVVSAPQFHENHVLTETFAFNVLMGRGWPPSAEDMDEAETLCRELGLGDVLDRMPAGMLQMVGETGWQLSHGERSRLFIARALLQRADLVILDESFAALDPETLRRCLDCVLKRASTLLVIAHP